MDSDVVARINRAVDECLERCTCSRTPEREISTFLQEAERTGLLFADEIPLVESTVKRLLAEQS